MDANNLAKNTPNALKFIFPICLQAQKFVISMKKKASLDVRSPC